MSDQSDNNRSIKSPTVAGGDRAKLLDHQTNVSWGPNGSGINPVTVPVEPMVAVPPLQGSPGVYQDGNHEPFVDLKASGTLGSHGDKAYPSLPNKTLTGAAGTTNAGPQGTPVDWASVGPYRYQEFPLSAPSKTGFAGSLRGHTVID